MPLESVVESLNRTFYEFFAGGGMARLGLGTGWTCMFANDFDEKKAATYRTNHTPADKLHVGDIGMVTRDQLPGIADLAWASFPCQDLSLAGAGAGLKGERSGTFWPFWKLIEELRREARQPRTVILENVYGALTSHGGRDFAEIASALHRSRYRFGAMILDAVHWVPQSRPRLFIVGVLKDLAVPAALVADGPDDEWHPHALRRAHTALPTMARKGWVWWHIPKPPQRNISFVDIVEDVPTGTPWHTREETKYLLSLMAPLHLRKLEKAKKLSRSTDRMLVGGVYKRTRHGAQRAEVRFDDVAGCLRTPAGGSSRQTIIVVEKGKVRSRLLSTREAARLMGIPEEYALPNHYNTAYHIAGDGVAVPVVRHIAANILEPVLAANDALAVAAE